MGTLIDLDDYAREQWDTFCRATEEMNDAKVRREKAKEALFTFFEAHDADTGVIENRPAVRYERTDRHVIDTERLRKEAPFLYRQYAKISTARYLRTVDGA